MCLSTVWSRGATEINAIQRLYQQKRDNGISSSVHGIAFVHWPTEFVVSYREAARIARAKREYRKEEENRHLIFRDLELLRWFPFLFLSPGPSHVHLDCLSLTPPICAFATCTSPFRCRVWPPVCDWPHAAQCSPLWDCSSLISSGSADCWASCSIFLALAVWGLQLSALLCCCYWFHFICCSESVAISHKPARSACTIVLLSRWMFSSGHLVLIWFSYCFLCTQEKSFCVKILLECWVTWILLLCHVLNCLSTGPAYVTSC